MAALPPVHGNRTVTVTVSDHDDQCRADQTRAACVRAFVRLLQLFGLEGDGRPTTDDDVDWYPHHRITFSSLSRRPHEYTHTPIRGWLEVEGGYIMLSHVHV